MYPVVLLERRLKLSEIYTTWCKQTHCDKKKNCLWLTVLKKLNFCNRRSQGKPEILTDTVWMCFYLSTFPLVHKHLLSPGRNLGEEI